MRITCDVCGGSAPFHECRRFVGDERAAIPNVLTKGLWGMVMTLQYECEKCFKENKRTAFKGFNE